MKLVFLLLMMTLALTRCPWGEESLLREDTDESLWFFGPAGENNYRVAGVGLDFTFSSKFTWILR